MKSVQKTSTPLEKKGSTVTTDEEKKKEDLAQEHVMAFQREIQEKIKIGENARSILSIEI